MNLGKIIVLLSFVFLTVLSAQAQTQAPSMSPLECEWPTYKENATELEKRVADMDSSMYCVNETAGKWLSELDELDKFLEGKDIVNAFISRLKVIQDSYQYLKLNCSLDENKNHPFCISFNEKILNSPWIQIVYFHSVIMMNNVELLKSWVSNMPIYDVNKMIHMGRLANAKFRFTLAEKVAGAPYMKVEILKALGDLGLLHTQSDESFPLTYAISNGRLEAVKYLVEFGFDPNASDSKPLSKYLTEEQLRISDPQDGYTPLIRAIGYDNRAIFDYLVGLPNIDMNRSGVNDGNSPLMIAAHHFVYGGDSYFYKKLLADSRVDINHQNKGGGTILTWLAEFQAPPSEVKRILKDPRFDPSRHFSKDRASLAAVIGSRDLNKVKAYESLFDLTSASSRVYRYKNQENLTVFEYIDQLIAGDLSRSQEIDQQLKGKMSQIKRNKLLLEQERIPTNINELKKIKKYLLSKLPK